jgi:hypothetical protein
MRIRFRARVLRALVPSRPPLRLLAAEEGHVEGLSPAWAGGLILSGWARPAGEDLWEAEIPEEAADLLEQPAGVFPFLASHPRGPFAGRGEARSVLIAPVPGWEEFGFLVPPILWDELLSVPQEGLSIRALAEQIQALRDTGRPEVWAWLGEKPARLARGKIPWYGFGSSRANLAAWGGWIARIPGGREGLALALLRLRVEDPEAWVWASPAMAPFLGGPR